MPRRSWLVVLWAAACAAGCTAAGTGTTGDPADVFRGQTVRLVVGVGPGGGQDTYARVIAPHLGRHLPGRPTVVVENMPGAGGLVAASHLARRAEPNGLTIALFNAQVVFSQILGDAPQYDVRDLPLVGSPASDGYVCIFVRTSGHTLDTWRAGRAPRLGITNFGSSIGAATMLLAKALALPVRVVPGHAGTAEMRAGMASGELDGACPTRTSFSASFLPRETYVPVLQGGGDAEDLLPGVPRAEDLVATARGKQLLAVGRAAGDMNRFVALPARTPASMVATLRRAFDDTMSDPLFLESAHKARLEVRPVRADVLEARMRELLSLPDDLRAVVVDALKGSTQ
jgi:hypothetical protein